MALHKSLARKVLQKAFWQKEIGDIEIVILHRGAPGDRKVIAGILVSNVARDGFYYKSGGRETFIPFHRILEVTDVKKRS